MNDFQKAKQVELEKLYGDYLLEKLRTAYHSLKDVSADVRKYSYGEGYREAGFVTHSFYDNKLPWFGRKEFEVLQDDGDLKSEPRKFEILNKSIEWKKEYIEIKDEISEIIIDYKVKPGEGFRGKAKEFLGDWLKDFNGLMDTFGREELKVTNLEQALGIGIDNKRIAKKIGDMGEKDVREMTL